MAAVPRSSKHDVMFNCEDIDLSKHQDLVIRISKAFEKHDIHLLYMCDTSSRKCETLTPKQPKLSIVLHNIESQYSPEDELKFLIANHLNMKNVKQIAHYEKQVATGRTILEKASKLENPSAEQKKTIDKTRRFLPKHEKSLEEAKRTGERQSILENVERVVNPCDLMQLVFERGVYYIFKYLYCVRNVAVPRSLAEGQKTVIHSQVDESNKVVATSEGVSDKVHLHFGAAAGRVSKLFECLKTVSSFGREYGSKEVNYRLERDVTSIRKMDMSSMAVMFDG